MWENWPCHPFAEATGGWRECPLPPCLSLPEAVRKADPRIIRVRGTGPAPHLNITVGLSQVEGFLGQPVPSMRTRDSWPLPTSARGGVGAGVMASPPPPSEEVWRTGLEVMRVGELALSLVH